jgi:hypothetical protein
MENIENTEALSIETSNTESTDVGSEPAEPKTPAWESFIAATKAHAEALGLETKMQKGYFQIKNAATAHKLYIALQARKVKRVDTTLPLVGVLAGAQELEKGPGSNGRIVCHVPAEMDVMTEVLAMLASDQFGNLPAPKRAPKAAAEESESTEQVAE